MPARYLLHATEENENENNPAEIRGAPVRTGKGKGSPRHECGGAFSSYSWVITRYSCDSWVGVVVGGWLVILQRLDSFTDGIAGVVE